MTYAKNKMTHIYKKINTILGWGAFRKWPLIRPSPTHTVCSQTKITGSEIWFGRTVVWSEVTSVWGWYDQRSFRDWNGLIRSGFKRTLVWSEKIWSATGSDQIPFRAAFFSFDFLFFLPRDVGSAKRQQTKSSILITDTRVWWSQI